MKRYITYFVTSIILSLCLCNIFSGNGKAAAAGDVKIDAVNFPDSYVRAAIKEKDSDKNGVLSQEEINKVKKLSIVAQNEKTEEKYSVNLHGISIFTNIADINVAGTTIEHEEELFSLPHIEKLGLSYDCKMSKLDMGKFSNIKSLFLYATEVNEIDLSKNTKLEKLDIYIPHTQNMKQLDLSNNKNLTFLELATDNPDKVLVGSAINLSKLVLWMYGTGSVNIGNLSSLKEFKIQYSHNFDKLNINNCQKLETCNIETCKKLTKVNLSTLPNLKELNIKTEKLKELNVSSLTNLTKIKLITPKLKKLVVSQKSKLHTLWIFASDLTNLDMSRMRKIESLDIRSKKIKKINMSYAKQLQYLHMYNLKNLKHLDLSKQKKLIQLDLASMKKLKKIVFPKKKISWERIELVNCKALDIPMEKLSKVKELCVRGNKKISTLDLRKFKRLYELEWTEGVLKKVKWGKPKKLTFLNVNSNKLSGKWDLRKNLSGVSKIECYDNRLTTIIGGKHNVLLYCDKNRLKKVDMRATKNLSVLSCVKNKGVRVYMPTELEDGPNVDRSAKVIYKK